MAARQNYQQVLSGETADTSTKPAPKPAVKRTRKLWKANLTADFSLPAYLKPRVPPLRLLLGRIEREESFAIARQLLVFRVADDGSDGDVPQLLYPFDFGVLVQNSASSNRLFSVTPDDALA